MFRRIAAALCLCFAALTAHGRAAESVVPGQRLYAELGPFDDVTVLVDIVAGTPFGLTATSFKGTTLRLDVAVADPDGEDVDLGTLKKTNSKASAVTVKGWKPARTGSYRVKVSSINGTRGGFDLVLSGAAPRKLSGTGTIAAADATADLPFDALPGDTVKCVVKPAKKSKLKPVIARFTDAGGAETVVGGPKQAAPIAVATMGTSRFTVSGDGVTTGAFTWTLTFVRVKAPKTKRDAAELNAVGNVTGVVVVDGQAPRTESLRAAKSRRPRRAPDVRPGEVVLDVPGAADWHEAERAAETAMPGTDCTVTAALSDRGPYLVRVAHVAGLGAGARAKAVTRALAASAAAAPSAAAAIHIAGCTPNVVVTACAEPNDPLYPQQFHLAQIGAPKAWLSETGDASIVVAVIDTGRFAHPDILTQWAGGYDFVSVASSPEDGDGWDADPTDDAHDFHGLHVAGTIGAKTNNGTGVSGVLWNTRLLAVRVLGKDGGSFFDVAAGLRWAAGLAVPNAPLNTNPARVVNLSLGAAYDDPTMRAAVTEVLGRGVVVVAAAGNEGSSERFYPAAYPGVVPVYALDTNQTWASYSNWGDWISVGAPGGDSPRGQPGILSTFFDMTSGKPVYQELSGTSMASPQVAGIAALMLAAKPALTPAEVLDILQKTALDLGPPGYDVDYGWGAVSASAAIDYVLTPFAPPNAIDVTPASMSFDWLTNESLLFVRTKAATPVTIQDVAVTTGSAVPWLTVQADSMVTPATLTVTVDSSLTPGSYAGRIRLTTSAGVVDVPVRAVRTPRPTLNAVRVAAVSPTGEIVRQATTTAAMGWAYEIGDLPLGRYRITTFADMNSNLQLDRVDEWEGIWPLRTQPQYVGVSSGSLDADTVNVPLERYDARFAYSGVGQGHVSGAIAVRVTNARTGMAVEGASVHVGGGQPLAITDGRGRAVLVGALTGAQVVTVVAPGYGPMTRAGQDAQYLSFALDPPAAVATTPATVTVRGLTSQDRTVWVQAGDARASAIYDGVTDPVVGLAYTATAEPVPVSVFVLDAAGVPTKSALLGIESPAAAFDVTVTALPIGGAQARYVTPTAPAANFTASGATVTGTYSLRWNDSVWTAVGETALALGQRRQVWFADAGNYPAGLRMKLDVVATDTTGRSTRHTYFGNSDDIQTLPNESFTFVAPPAITSPANGATNVALAPTLTWTAAISTHLHRIVIEEVGTSWRWNAVVGGGTVSFQLPAVASGGLKAATNYRWRVETLKLGATSFDWNSYREERLDVEPTDRVVSAWATFRTQ